MNQSFIDQWVADATDMGYTFTQQKGLAFLMSLYRTLFVKGKEEFNGLNAYMVSPPYDAENYGNYSEKEIHNVLCSATKIILKDIYSEDLYDFLKKVPDPKTGRTIDLWAYKFLPTLDPKDRPLTNKTKALSSFYNQLTEALGEILDKEGNSISQSYGCGLIYCSTMFSIDEKGTQKIIMSLNNHIPPAIRALFMYQPLFRDSPEILKTNHWLSLVFQLMLSDKDQKYWAPIYSMHQIYFYEENALRKQLVDKLESEEVTLSLLKNGLKAQKLSQAYNIPLPDFKEYKQHHNPKLTEQRLSMDELLQQTKNDLAEHHGYTLEGPFENKADKVQMNLLLFYLAIVNRVSVMEVVEV